MSGTTTLVYKQGSVAALKADLDTMRTNLKSSLDTMFAAVDADLTGWSLTTASRQGERQYQAELRKSLDATLDALDTLSTALADVGEMAETAETRNVAVMA